MDVITNVTNRAPWWHNAARVQNNCNEHTTPEMLFGWFNVFNVYGAHLHAGKKFRNPKYFLAFLQTGYLRWLFLYSQQYVVAFIYESLIWI